MKTFAYFVGVCILMPISVGVATPVTDPTGDSVSHDITEFDGVSDGTDLELSAEFATGTLDQNNFGLLFFLDTDQNSATGNQVGVPVGHEYAINFNSSRSPTLASLFQFSTNSVIASNLATTFGVDSVSLSVPLSLINDDGLANFGMAAGEPIDMVAFSGDDLAGIDDSSSASIGITTAPPSLLIPEPSSLALAALGLLVLMRSRRRRTRIG